MAAATAAAASTMSLLPISQLRQQQHGAGAVVVFRRRPRDARRRRYVVPVRDPLPSRAILVLSCSGLFGRGELMSGQGLWLWVLCFDYF
jgi:hypothetical protein